MTYEQSYMNSKDYESLIREIKLDIAYALLYNQDRLKPIRDAAEKVMKEKYSIEYSSLDIENDVTEKSF